MALKTTIVRKGDVSSDAGIRISEVNGVTNPLVVKPPMEPNPQISTRYNYPSIKQPVVDFPAGDPNSRSLTNQSDLDSTDINKIMARYEKNGLILDDVTGNMRVPNYGDFSNVGDYHQLSITLAKVKEAFDVLPANVRAKFLNDPAVLVAWLDNPANDAEAVKLGLKDASVLPKDTSDPEGPKSFGSAPNNPLNTGEAVSRKPEDNLKPLKPGGA